MKREINITNSKSKVIEQYYTLVNPLLGKNKLGPVEIKVISKMALVYNTYNHLGDIPANILLFSRQSGKDIRKAVSEELGTTFNHNSYGNILSRLRKKGVITFDKILYLPPLKDNKIELSINLIVKPE